MRLFVFVLDKWMDEFLDGGGFIMSRRDGWLMDGLAYIPGWDGQLTTLNHAWNGLEIWDVIGWKYRMELRL